VNWAAILAAARRAQAAYLGDTDQAQLAFEALGLRFHGHYQNDSHQAVLSQDAGGAVFLSISGTRFAQGKLGDLRDDIDLQAMDLGQGAKVTAGAYGGLDAMWRWAKSLVPHSSVFNVEGHSLGAWRTRYTPCFLPREQIGALHGFESPKGANRAFWTRYATELAGMVHVINGRDAFVAWPPVGDWCHPDVNHVWLTQTGFKLIPPQVWPGPLSFADHDIDDVVERLVAIAGESAVPAWV